MQDVRGKTQAILLALALGQLRKRLKGPLTLLVIGAYLGLGVSLLYRLAAARRLKKTEPGSSRLHVVMLRDATSSRQRPSGSATRSSR